MKKKYSISFFAAMAACAILLMSAYQISYNHAREEAAKKNSAEQLRAVPTEGNASASGSVLYYLKDLDGFLAVYCQDRKTVYEYTDIRIDELPEDIASEVAGWKPVETLESLYGFLENYSS